MLKACVIIACMLLTVLATNKLVNLQLFIASDLSTKLEQVSNNILDKIIVEPANQHIIKNIILDYKPVPANSLAPMVSVSYDYTCRSLLVPLLEFQHISRGFTRDHLGIDLVAPFSSIVTAADDGIILRTEFVEGYGNMIDIQHDNNVVTRYAHLKAFSTGVRPGKIVSIGDPIGKVGMSGHTTGPHLHFEVHVRDVEVDPSPWLGLSACKNK